MSSSFTRILAKKLCRVVICSPPNPSTTTTTKQEHEHDEEDVFVGLVHDHRYADSGWNVSGGRKSVSPGIPAKRSRSIACNRSLSCTCVDCLQPSLTPTTSSDLVSFASGVQVRSHDLAPDERAPRATPMTLATSASSHSLASVASTASTTLSLRTAVKLEAVESDEGAAALSPTSSNSSGTEHRLTSSFKCRICTFQSEKLSEYMVHLETEHAWIGRVRFQCHFCPERFGSYAELVAHSRRYLDQIGAGTPPPPAYPTASTEIAKITLH